jgi:hypothetical protein
MPIVGVSIVVAGRMMLPARQSRGAVVIWPPSPGKPPRQASLIQCSVGDRIN